VAAKNVVELLVELRAGEDAHTLMRMKQAWAAATVAAVEKFTAHNSESTQCLHHHHIHDMGSIVCLDCGEVLPL